MNSISDQNPDPAQAPPGRHLKAAEVAALFRVTPRTVARWADAGRLACTRTLGGTSGPGHRRFAEAEVRALLCTLGGAL